MLANTTVEKQKPISFPRPELIIGEENREAFLEKLENMAEAECSVICISTREDSLDVLKSKRSNKLITYSPGEPENSHSFNWMPLYKNNDEASEPLLRQLTRTIMNADYRYKRSAAIYNYGFTDLKEVFSYGFGSKEKELCIDYGSYFLEALFRYVAEMPNSTPAKTYEYLSNILDNDNHKQLLSNLSSSTNERIKELTALFTKLDTNTCLHLMHIVRNALIFLFYDDVKHFTSNSPQAPNFGNLRDENYCVYLDLKEDNALKVVPLTSLFFSLATLQLKNAGNAKTVYLFVDNIARVGHILNLAIDVTVIRGCNIGLVLFTPSIEALERVYGEVEHNSNSGWETRVILANCVYGEPYKQVDEFLKTRLEQK